MNTYSHEYHTLRVSTSSLAVATCACSVPYLSIHPSIYPSIYLSIYVYIHMYMHITP